MRICFILCLTFVFQTVACHKCLKTKWHPFTGKRHVAAVILARGGSKGIPMKNLAQVGGRSLLSRSLITLQLINDFDSVWVSTDHGLIATEGELYGANIHWRTPETATDEATSIFAVQEFLDSHTEVDVVALIQCTSPFLQKQFLTKALHFIYSGKECAFSVTHSYKLRWSAGVAGIIKPLNFKPENRPRRQDWNGEFVENGMFYFASRKLLKNGYFQSHQ